MNDELTGLLNPAAFRLLVEHELRVARRTGRLDALLVIDIDDLQSVNENYGNDEGDETLCAVGRLLRETARDSDIVGRIGGDEFAVFALDCAGNALAERISSAVTVAATAFNAGPARALAVGMSIGITDVRPEETFDALLGRAGAALFKSRGSRHGMARTGA
ncbi:MAG: GGDEF domain-containing protein [Gemmatimonadaceae bacterium]